MGKLTWGAVRRSPEPDAACNVNHKAEHAYDDACYAHKPADVPLWQAEIGGRVQPPGTPRGEDGQPWWTLPKYARPDTRGKLMVNFNPGDRVIGIASVSGTRARTRLGQATGLLQGLDMLVQSLRAWPDSIHPQLLIDGEAEPAVRANALAALADPEGLLGDVREISLDTGAGVRLTVRDVERALAVPRPEDARSPESVRRQLTALRRAAVGDPDVPVHQLAAACRHVQTIAAWCRSHLGDQAPDLLPLQRMLELFVPAPDELDAVTAVPPSPAATSTAAAVDLRSPSLAAELRPVTRDDALAAIRQVRDWFELHEPSSPVPALLRQAERMVGRRFSEVADWVPLDLLRKWDAEDEQDMSRGGRP